MLWLALTIACFQNEEAYIIRLHGTQKYLTNMKQSFPEAQLGHPEAADIIRISQYSKDPSKHIIAPDSQGGAVFTIDEEKDKLMYKPLVYNYAQLFEIAKVADYENTYHIKMQKACLTFMPQNNSLQIKQCDPKHIKDQMFDIVKHNMKPKPLFSKKDQKKKAQREKEKQKKNDPTGPDTQDIYATKIPFKETQDELKKMYEGDPPKMMHESSELPWYLNKKGQKNDGIDLRKFTKLDTKDPNDNRVNRVPTQITTKNE
ncbi:hypothetical protein EDEG_01383 [Edhazardia aedis USNM 41457]|uniref:Ricin B lectin domain-containing protein n=1 Tax=Edhazardia aedis (strain USNM 41457) TaxID=1003232 RepID=J8ZXF7_EDHAE|nr:hypothetical protein EDEG_01383 [Edhazardia aedis USNM 41457]|eukprot:EJW04368.1 hypothetical protein EDEG_01383 [Edhazardia aedis USNM 41457]